MIQIEYFKENQTILEWEERLKDMIVGFKMVRKNEDTQPLLIDKNIRLEGVAAINNFLDDLEKDLGEWRTPRCGV